MVLYGMVWYCMVWYWHCIDIDKHLLRLPILIEYSSPIPYRADGESAVTSTHSENNRPCSIFPSCITVVTTKEHWYGMVWYGMVWYGMVSNLYANSRSVEANNMKSLTDRLPLCSLTQPIAVSPPTVYTSFALPDLEIKVAELEEEYGNNHPGYGMVWYGLIWFQQPFDKIFFQNDKNSILYGMYLMTHHDMLRYHTMPRRTIAAKCELGLRYDKLTRYKEANALHKSVLDARLTVNGTDSPDTATGRDILYYTIIYSLMSVFRLIWCNNLNFIVFKTLVPHSEQYNTIQYNKILTWTQPTWILENAYVSRSYSPRPSTTSSNPLPYEKSSLGRSMHTPHTPSTRSQCYTRTWGSLRRPNPIQQGQRTSSLWYGGVWYDLDVLPIIYTVFNDKYESSLR